MPKDHPGDRFRNEFSIDQCRIFAALMNPRFPRRIRTAPSLAKETGLPIETIRSFCTATPAIIVGLQRSAGWYGVDRMVATFQYPEIFAGNNDPYDNIKQVIAEKEKEGQ